MPPFITLEGGEGAGKSTAARRLAAALERAGQGVFVTREPGGSPGAEAVRGLLLARQWDPWAELLLMFAARREHLAAGIRPALAAGRWVVCDRFTDSTLAYQGTARGLAWAPIEALVDLALDGTWPDFTLILDVPPELGMARAGQRGEVNRFEAAGLGFHERVRAGFLRVAERWPARCVVIDASGNADAVFAAIARAVSARFGLALAAAAPA